VAGGWGRWLGPSRYVIREYVEGWIVEIEDYSPRVARIYHLLQSGQAEKAKRLLPHERVYPVSPEVGRRILLDV
jgi:hypothetical protein